MNHMHKEVCQEEVNVSGHRSPNLKALSGGKGEGAGDKRDLSIDFRNVICSLR